jgi:cytochrome c oxidase subunit I
MLSVGKLFAIAAIAALVLGLTSWPPQVAGHYEITVKSRSHGFSSDYWAFSIGAIFALFAAVYYWFPILFSRSPSSRISLLHFWLSALAAFAFLFLAPGLQALTAQRDTGVSSNRAMIAVLVIATISTILFLVAQVIFLASFFWSAIFGKTIGQ